MSPRSSAFSYVIYAVAFAAGAAVSWAFMSFFAGQALAPDQSLPVGLLIFLTWLSPLAGLAVFQILFGLLTRHWRGARFWLVAPAVVYGVLAIFFGIVFLGFGDLVEASVGALVAIFICGLLLLHRSLRG